MLDLQHVDTGFRTFVSYHECRQLKKRAACTSYSCGRPVDVLADK